MNNTKDRLLAAAKSDKTKKRLNKGKREVLGTTIERIGLKVGFQIINSSRKFGSQIRRGN